jgi:4-hydroxybenzoate polyprenyltransferase
MTINQEDKTLKLLSVVGFLTAMPIVNLISNDIVKCAILIPLVLAMSILFIRKYKRDKKQGKDVSKYKTWLLYIGISVFIFIIFILLPYF